VPLFGVSWAGVRFSSLLFLFFYRSCPPPPGGSPSNQGVAFWFLGGTMCGGLPPFIFLPQFLPGLGWNVIIPRDQPGTSQKPKQPFVCGPWFSRGGAKWGLVAFSNLGFPGPLPPLQGFCPWTTKAPKPKSHPFQHPPLVSLPPFCTYPVVSHPPPLSPPRWLNFFWPIFQPLVTKTLFGFVPLGPVFSFFPLGWATRGVVFFWFPTFPGLSNPCRTIKETFWAMFFGGKWVRPSPHSSLWVFCLSGGGASC